MDMHRRSSLALVFATCLFALTAAPAQASPGALDILIVNSYTGAASFSNFQTQLSAEPGVHLVETFNAAATADGGAGLLPSDELLSHYDAVVMAEDKRWGDMILIGDRVADYAERGGVVVTDGLNYVDPSLDVPSNLAGRWVTGGFAPFTPTMDGPVQAVTLGTHESANPVMSGVAPLANFLSFAKAVPTPGAIKLADWDNMRPAIVIKGRALGINASLNNNVANTGKYGHLVANAAKTLGRRNVTVGLGGTGKGSLTASAGPLACSATACTGAFLAGANVTFSAKAAKGSAFGGWGQVCPNTSLTCAIDVGYPGLSVDKWETIPIGARFLSTQVKFGKFKKGKLEIKLPSAGKIVIKAPGIATVKKNVKRAGRSFFKIKPKSKLKKKIAKNGSAKVKFKVTFIPAGVTVSGVTKKTVKLAK
jgi:hypothetical protein